MTLVKMIALLTLCSLSPFVELSGAEALDGRAAALLSEISSLREQGYISSDVERLVSELDALVQEAGNAADQDRYLMLLIHKSEVVHSLAGDSASAKAWLLGIIQSSEEAPPARVREAYIQLAEIHADLGEEARIMELIEGFRGSNWFDSQSYATEMQSGPTGTVKMVRPGSSGKGSITETRLQALAVSARLAPGNSAPDFFAVTAEGETISLADFAGRVVLLDFFMPESEAWKRSHTRIKYLHKNLSDRGFAVLGISQGPFQRASLPWTVVKAGREMSRAYAAYGDLQQILIGPDGRILGRNLSSANLRETVMETLPPTSD